MSKNTTNTTKATANNSIIEVVVNGMTAMDSVNEVKTRIENVEKSVFNIALITVYGTGTTIPAYTDSKGNEHGEATCEKSIKQADFIKLVGRSKQTISRWCVAMKLVIDSGYFSDFATGVYPFSYDKIILIFGKETSQYFENYVLADLMNLSVDTLETMTKKKDNETEENAQAEEKAEEVTEEVTEENAQTSDENTVISYNGKEYTVNKLAFEKWLSENAITE